MILRSQASRTLVRQVSRMATSQRRKEPLIAVMGTTGTGKSDLAVDLAVRFNGEIINADAMQMYRGMPIITNQISETEKRGIPHHLLATIDYSEPTWTVDIFAQEAKRLIGDIRQRGKLPIVVGGTHYYINALLFESSLVRAGQSSDEGSSSSTKHQPPEEISAQFPILDASTEKILQRLREVDPVMADRWHPGERRKIRRSLEIFLTTGKRASDIYAEQQEEKKKLASEQQQEASQEDQSRRRPWDTLMFWVYSKPDILAERLNKRVDKMVDRGLMDEVKTLHEYLLEESDKGGEVADRTRGIWQSIGFKQLEPFLDAERNGGGGSAHQEKDLEKLKQTCYEDIRTATRQYARSQLKWIRHKTVPPLNEHGAFEYLYLLDSSNAENFTSDVLTPASGICADFLKNGCGGGGSSSSSSSIIIKPSEVSETAREVLSLYDNRVAAATPKEPIKTMHCEVCESPILSDSWGKHVAGKKHKRAQRAKVKRALVVVPAAAAPAGTDMDSKDD